MKTLKFFCLILILFGSFIHAPVSAAIKCSDVHHDGVSVDLDRSVKTFFDGSAVDQFSRFRTNIGHFWNMIGTRALSGKALEKALLSIKGVGTGDFHIMNVGDVEQFNGKREIGLVDMDDGGAKVSLLGDVLRGAVGSKLSPFRLKFKEMWKAYVDGLRQSEMDAPRVVRDMRNESAEAFRARQKRYFDKMVNGERFSPESGLQRLEQATGTVVRLYREAEATFRRSLSGTRILDVAYKIKDSGGSKGKPRYWFLVERAGEKMIIEFKYFGESATTVMDSQGDPRSRFDVLERGFRPIDKVVGYYNVVLVGEHTFHMRQRIKGFLDFDPAKNTRRSDIKDGQEYWLYLFNWLGLKHGAQKAGQELLALIQKDEDAAFDVFANLARDYINGQVTPAE